MNKDAIAIRFGGFCALGLILVLVFTDLLRNVDLFNLMGALNLVLFFVFGRLALNQSKGIEEGEWNFKRVFSKSFKTNIFASAITLGFCLLFFHFISDGLPQMSMDVSLKALEDKNLSQEEMDAALGIMKKVNGPTFFSLLRFISLAFGSLFIALLHGLILKDKKEALA